jgi:hypothetical protein
MNDVAKTLEGQGIERFIADQKTATDALGRKSTSVTTG